MRLRTPLLTTALSSALLVTLSGTAAADSPSASPSSGLRSNMGLCSPFLASLEAPLFAGETLGGNARSGVNLLIKRIGPMLPDQISSPGELYRIRAQQHPDAPAELECTPRPGL